MDSSHEIKRARLESDKSLKALPQPESSSTSISSPRRIIIVGTIPSLVVEIVLTSLKDVELLKTCRLVCRNWNIQACQALKDRSITFLKEGSQKLKNFRALMLSRAFGPLSQLPTPIQNFHVEPHGLKDANFMELVHLPNTKITDLTLSLNKTGPEVNQAQLGRLLATKSSFLTDLTLFFEEKFKIQDKSLLESNSIQLTSLKRWKLQDSCVACNHKVFMKNILGNCLPEQINLEILDGTMLYHVLSDCNVTNLRELILQFQANIPVKSLILLGRLPELKKLTINGKLLESDEDHFESFLENVSGNLEDLASNICIDICFDKDLVFPKLKSFDMSNNNSWTSFTPQRFPSLIKITSRLTSSDQILENYFNPHDGVEKVLILISSSCSFSSASDQSSLLILFEFLSRQFPKINYLGLRMSKFYDNTFMDIYNSLPGLKALNLDGSCDLFGMSGLQSFLVKEYLEEGWPIERIPRRKSLLDFSELESVTLGRRFVVDPDKVIYCLARIPQLKCLGFFWNKSLTAELIQDYLSHLGKITIFNSSDVFPETLIKLSKMMENVKLQIGQKDLCS